MQALLIGALAAAGATETVVVDRGLPEDAIGRVRPHTAAELSPLHVEELRASRPAVLGAGSVPACPTEPLPAQGLQDRVYATTGALLYMEYGRARDEIGSALAAAPCVTGPGLRPPLAELYYLQGLVDALEGRPSDAVEAFRRARVLGLTTWNSDLGEVGQDLFERSATAPAPEVGLKLLAPDRATPPSIDGGPWPVDGRLDAGPHVVVDGERSILFELVPLEGGAGEAVLVLPDAFPPTSLEWAALPETRGALSSLLAGALGEGAPVWVLTGDEAWHGTAGRTDWSALPAPAPRGAAAAGPWTAERRRRPVATGALWGGGAVAVAGAVTSVALVGVAARADRARVAATTPAAYDDAERRYRQAATGIVVGRGAAAAGGAVAALGLTLYVVR